MWPQYKAFRETWKKYNPGFKFMLWTCQDFEYDKYSYDSNLILKSNDFWELKFDVVTWEILRLYGGIKTDNDMICLKSFKPLLKYNSFAGRNWGECEMGVQLVGMSKGNPLTESISAAVTSAILLNRKRAHGGRIYAYTDFPAYPFLKKCELVLSKEAFNPFGWQVLQKGGKSINDPANKIKELLTENNWYPDSYSVHCWGSVMSGGWTKIMKEKKAEACRGMVI
jgi:hypothetical protein